MSRTAPSIVVSFLTAATVSLGCGGGTATPGGSTTAGMAGRGSAGTPGTGGTSGAGGTMPPGPMGSAGTGKMMKPGMMGTGGTAVIIGIPTPGTPGTDLPGWRPQRHGAAGARLHTRQRARVPVDVRRLCDQRDQRADRHDRRFDLLLRTDHHHHDHHGLDAGRHDRIPARDGGRAGVLPLPHHLRPGVRRQHVRRQRDRLGHEGPHVQGSRRQRSRRAVAVRRDAGAGVDVRHRLHHRQRRLGLPLRRAGRQRRRGKDAGGRRETRPRVDLVARSKSERLRLLQELRLRRRLHHRLAGDRRATTRPTRPPPTGTTASSTRSGSTPPRSPARASAAPASRSSTRRRPRPAPTPSP